MNKKIFGFGLMGFSIFGWFSFLFAGSGFAALIAIVLFFIGLALFSSEK